MIKIGIVGATGYTGAELLRLLVSHPNAEVIAVTSRQEAGRPVADIFPNLRGHLDLQFTAPADESFDGADLVFFATPNGTAMQSTGALLERGIKVIDLAADFRLKDIPTWEQWYDQKHADPELVSEAVYGLPELHRSNIAKARLIACPGCYPTAVQLGFAPLLEAKAVDTHNLIADAKSGVSGAGRGASVGNLYSECADSFKAYAVAGHRHLPEIKQGMQLITGNEPGLVFVPHLTPMIRGIHATLYARLTDASLDVQKLFEDRYADEAFVDVMSPGQQPDTRSVRGANVCRISVTQAPGSDWVVVSSVIDNLVKGAAGQALQNMNLLFDLPESTGLSHAGMLP